MTTTPEETALCQEWVLPEWGAGHPCNRKVKEDGLCGLHLGVRNRRDAKYAAWQAKHERLHAARKRNHNLAIDLAAATDIVWQHSAEGVWLKPDDAERLLTYLDSGM